MVAYRRFKRRKNPSKRQVESSVIIIIFNIIGFSPWTNFISGFYQVTGFGFAFFVLILITFLNYLLLLWAIYTLIQYITSYLDRKINT